MIEKVILRIPRTSIEPENTFLFSDPHFDHANIIKYCKRPFKSVEEMNETILRNYNKVVRDDSLLIFLGDMSFGRGSRPAKYWLQQLKGQRIIYIKGSHDHGIRPTNTNDCYDMVILGTLHLIHNYEDIQTPEWVIHGHNHNNRPLLNRKHKRINVSCDVTRFSPISLDSILELIKNPNLMSLHKKQKCHIIKV